MSAAKLPASPDPYAKETIQYIPCYDHFDPIWEMVTKYDGEGIVAKKTNSKWLEKSGRPIGSNIKILNKLMFV